jgi:hypothetical protein
MAADIQRPRARRSSTLLVDDETVVVRIAHSPPDREAMAALLVP